MGGPYKDFRAEAGQIFLLKGKSLFTNLKDDVFGSESYRIDPSS